MSETYVPGDRKPHPPGPGQCPTCHRALWEPCLHCRQTGLQRPAIVWCPTCRQPGRGEHCAKCGTKLHAPPVCPRCGGLGWLPAHHACLAELHTDSVPRPRQQHRESGVKRSPRPAAAVVDSPDGQWIGDARPDFGGPAQGDLQDPKEGPSRLAGFLRAAFVIMLVVILIWYLTLYRYW